MVQSKVGKNILKIAWGLIGSGTFLLETFRLIPMIKEALKLKFNDRFREKSRKHDDWAIVDLSL